MQSRCVIILLGLMSGANSLAGQGAPACPPPQVETTGWFEVIADSPMVVFRLPPGFTRKVYKVSFGHLPPRQEWRREGFLTFRIEESAGPDILSRATPRRQEWTADYSECSELLHGAPAVIQAQRGSGTIFNNGQESKTFDVYATVERRPGLYVRVWGTAASRTDQEVLLAIVRTISLR